MKKQRFTGPMGEKMKQHIELRRAMGYIYKAPEFTLDAFDQYLKLNHPHCQTISRNMITGYLEITKKNLPLSRAAHLTHLRQFCRFLFQFDVNTYIPEKGLLPPGKVQVRPHIFTEDEVISVMVQAKKLNVKNKLLPHTYITIIGLLWTTGMRVGEVVNLKINDIDLINERLYVRETKFFKSRMIPLLSSTIQHLRDYLYKRKKQGFANIKDNYLFVSNRGKPCITATVPRMIRELIIRAGIKADNNKIPRVHDLRHSFATRWLTEIYQSGKDPNSYLPVLATYLGHTNIANTQVYLHPSTELLDIAGKKLHTYLSSQKEKNNV